MKREGSILWILFLLAALVIGPAVILRRPVSAVEPASLRDSVQQERLVDAPADIKGTVPTAASDDAAVLQ